MIAVTQENSSVNQQAIPVGEVLDLRHLLQENQTLRCERNYYKSLLERAIAREELLKQEIQQLNARIRYLEKRLYSRKSCTAVAGRDGVWEEVIPSLHAYTTVRRTIYSSWQDRSKRFWQKTTCITTTMPSNLPLKSNELRYNGCCPFCYKRLQIEKDGIFSRHECC